MLQMVRPRSAKRINYLLPVPRDPPYLEVEAGGRLYRITYVQGAESPEIAVFRRDKGDASSLQKRVEAAALPPTVRRLVSQMHRTPYTRAFSAPEGHLLHRGNDRHFWPPPGRLRRATGVQSRAV